MLLRNLYLLLIVAAALKAQNTKIYTLTKIYALLQGLNISAFSNLLHILVAEIERIVLERGPADTGQPTPNELLTATVRRILPALRHYSTWLLEEAPFLSAQDGEALKIRILAFWELYSRALTFLLSHLPLHDFPDIGYLLDEDEDTIAFIPFMEDIMNDRYYSPNGASRPSLSDAGVRRRHPRDETLFRIKQLVKDGEKLTTADVRSSQQ